MSGLQEYRRGSKRNWRGWQWNRIAERLDVPVEDAVVLYLCGPDDLDRQKALDRGFRNENIIAVDISEANIRKVRNGGGLGIAHDLIELVFAWPEDWGLHVIVADFCAGLDRSALALIPALAEGAATGSAMSSTVISVNLQRGRDLDSRDLRTFASNVYSRGEEVERTAASKHRGLLFYNEALSHGMLGQLPEDDRQWRWMERLCVLALPLRTSPTFKSYRSVGTLYFDTVVFRWLGRLRFPGRSGAFLVPDLSWWKDELKSRSSGIAAARRKIAACRAVRTTRLRSA